MGICLGMRNQTQEQNSRFINCLTKEPGVSFKNGKIAPILKFNQIKACFINNLFLKIMIKNT